MVLAVCTRDVKFYKWPSMDFIGTYEVSPDSTPVRNISWSCDGTKILIIKNQEAPLIAQAPVNKSETGISSRKFHSVNNALTGVFSKINPNLVALGMENGHVSLVDLKTKDLIRYRELPSGIQNLDFSFDDKNLLAGCVDGNIFLYNETGTPTASFITPNSCTLSTTLFSNYSNLIAAGSRDGTLAVWNSESTNLQFSCQQHKARITDIAFLENTVTTISTDGYLCLFDLRTHNLISKNNLEGSLLSLAYFPGSYDLAVGTYNQLRSYDLRNLKAPIKVLLVDGGYIKKIAASPVFIKNCTDIKNKASASGDYSNISNQPSIRSCMFNPFRGHSEPSEAPINDSELSSTKPSKTYKQSEVREFETFVNDYMVDACAQFEEKMLQNFYDVRINISKQFIFMGEKMEESWNNFIGFLKDPVEESVGLESSGTTETNIEEKNVK